MLIGACSGGDGDGPADTAGGARRPAPTATVAGALEQFMQARIAGDHDAVLAALTGEFRRGVAAGLPPELPLLQPENPCWYRYELLRSAEIPPAAATARVRVYEHGRGRDGAGGPPASWVQDIGFVRVGAAWQVESVSLVIERREEASEPRGADGSACPAAGR